LETLVELGTVELATALEVEEEEVLVLLELTRR
jgi:hypothetical protein